MSVRRPAAVGAACAVAVLIGGVGGLWWAAALAEPETHAAPPATRTVRAGPAQLEVPRAWQTLRASEGKVVLAPSPPLRDRVIVTVEPADHASLIGRSVRARTGELTAKPLSVELAGRPAWHYGGLISRTGDEALDVTVLPGRDAVLNVACVSPLGDVGAVSDCAAAITSVSIGDGPTLVPAPDLAVPAVLRELDGTRHDARAALAGAHSPAAQARLARRLADAHGDAAAALRPMPLVQQLSATASAYRSLAEAVGTTSAARLRAVRREVHTSEVGLARAVGAAGSRPVLAAAPAPQAPAPATAKSTPGWLLPAIVLLAALVFAGVTALLQRPRPRTSAPIEPAAAPVSIPVPARWDTPPDDLWAEPLSAAADVPR